MTFPQPEIRYARKGDFPEVVAILRAVDLLTDGLSPGMPDLYVAEINGVVVGCAALESDDRFGLLRSVGILPGSQGSGIGARIVDVLHARAVDLGLEYVYLLTTTAAEYFPKFGYERIDRADIPKVVSESAENSACLAAGAEVLRKEIMRQ